MPRLTQPFPAATPPVRPGAYPVTTHAKQRRQLFSLFDGSAWGWARETPDAAARSMALGLHAYHTDHWTWRGLTKPAA